MCLQMVGVWGQVCSGYSLEGEVQQKMYSWVWEWSRMVNPLRVGYSGDGGHGQKGEQILGECYVSRLLLAEIHSYRLCVLECRGEQSPGARSHGSVPGRGG